MPWLSSSTAIRYVGTPLSYMLGQVFLAIARQVCGRSSGSIQVSSSPTGRRYVGDGISPSPHAVPANNGCHEPMPLLSAHPLFVRHYILGRHKYQQRHGVGQQTTAIILPAFPTGTTNPERLENMERRLDTGHSPWTRPSNSSRTMDNDTPLPVAMAA
jgi:hypothetical protein